MPMPKLSAAHEPAHFHLLFLVPLSIHHHTAMTPACPAPRTPRLPAPPPAARSTRSRQQPGDTSARQRSVSAIFLAMQPSYLAPIQCPSGIMYIMREAIIRGLPPGTQPLLHRRLSRLRVTAHTRPLRPSTKRMVWSTACSVKVQPLKHNVQRSASNYGDQTPVAEHHQQASERAREPCSLPLACPGAADPHVMPLIAHPSLLYKEGRVR